jgi:predicted nucleotidyltransferase
MPAGDLSKDEIMSLLRESRARLSSLGVKSIGLFGSFVRDESSPESDVDILVEFHSDKKNYDNFIDTCFFLEELLEHKVEVVTADSMSPYIGPHVLEEVEYVSLSA